MNETRVDANEVIEELLEQLKQANLQMAILRVMLKKANSTPVEEPQI
jgi:hypothetical protein